MSETPEEQWAAIQMRQDELAKKALAAWAALSPEEQQRRMDEMEQKIKRERDIRNIRKRLAPLLRLPRGQ